MESTIADGGDRIGNGNRIDATATIESIIPDGGDGSADGERSEATATIESIGWYVSDVISYG